MGPLKINNNGSYEYEYKTEMNPTVRNSLTGEIRQWVVLAFDSCLPLVFGILSGVVPDTEPEVSP